MNTISQDKEKLLKLLQELEEEYQAENISDDEYNYLSKEYNDRLSNITAVDRIRSMQGKKVVEKPVIYSSKKVEKSKKEDEKLVDKYVVKTEKEKRELKAPSKKVLVTIAIMCLAAAFITGIGFGIFNFDFQPPNQTIAVVTVNESTFPIVKSNDTNKTNKNNITTNSSENSNRTNTDTTQKPNKTNTDTTQKPNRTNTNPRSNSSR